MGLNNVNLEGIQKSVEAAKADASKTKRLNRLEGTWNLEEGEPQFQARVKFEGGETTLEADQPSFLGGGGTRPGPVIYCLYGLASCFTATFASMAAMEGVPLKGLRVVAESELDFSRVFGLADRPVVEGVRVTLYVDSEASQEKIRELEALARERCPAVYCLTNPIPLVTEVEKE